MRDERKKKILKEKKIYSCGTLCVVTEITKIYSVVILPYETKKKKQRHLGTGKLTAFIFAYLSHPRL
jgi:predicted double-glycine peptidase